MNKNIFRILAFGMTAMFFTACNDSESDLLEPKLYFEERESHLSIEEGDNMSIEISSRLSSSVQSAVNVSYSLADSYFVEEYNAKYGTSYQLIDNANVALTKNTTSIPQGRLYAEKVDLVISNLSTIEEGKSYAIPLMVQSNDVATTQGGNVTFLLLNKPVKIKKMGKWDNDYIQVKFPVGTYFQSFTYEALINVDYFNGNSTIMGTEGIMIFRIGDQGGGIPKDVLQIAGGQHYRTKDPLKTKTWYHVAVTYDQPSGKTAIYVNGNKWAESAWSIPGFDPNADTGFFIGRIKDFPWGQRPFQGQMGELRVWSVARTANQIKQNMLTVDPKSEGLELYFKMNGTEKQEGGMIYDATGKIEAPASFIDIVDLDTPVEIK